MKRTALAFTAFTALAVGTIGAANAVDVGVGPGGVHVGPSHRGPYNEYRYGGHCRVVITHRNQSIWRAWRRAQAHLRLIGAKSFSKKPLSRGGGGI
jgi:hypothetical protein